MTSVSIFIASSEHWAAGVDEMALVHREVAMARGIGAAMWPGLPGSAYGPPAFGRKRDTHDARLAVPRPMPRRSNWTGHTRPKQPFSLVDQTATADCLQSFGLSG